MDNKITVNTGMTANNYSASVNIGDGIVVATGKTFEELKLQMQEAIDFHLDCLREDNEEIPVPFQTDYELSYKFDTENFFDKFCEAFRPNQFDLLTTAPDARMIYAK
jgi:predicted RNase H-like HicB family nuclease